MKTNCKIGRAGRIVFFYGIVVIMMTACETDLLFHKTSQTSTKDTSPASVQSETEISPNVPVKPDPKKVKPGPKKVVTIYDFRSSVSEISSRGATDMFTTALVKTEAFAVAERQQLEKGIKREKKLKEDKKATSRSKTNGVLTGADYIFEGTISEVAEKESDDENRVSISGMKLGSSKSASSIGLDVRVVDASTGKIIEAINVRKQIKSSGSDISGLGGLINKMTGNSLDADVSMKKTRKEGVDKVLRECIEEAISKIVSRLQED